MNYLPRLIDSYLKEWAEKPDHKPLLLRGARQVGKSSAVRHLGKSFKNFVEINFEKKSSYIKIFEEDLDVDRIVQDLSAISGETIKDGETLLFLDEIQDSPKAIMSLRFFREDRPNLHVIAAGSLLEFTLEELPTFGVGRIHSMFMFPMTFDEFLMANGENRLIEIRNNSGIDRPLSVPLEEKLIRLFRTYIMVGGMPEVVDKWVSTKDYLSCQELLDDLLISYETDFAKYKKKVDTVLLRNTLRSAALQLTSRFIYSRVSGNYKAYEVKNAIELLTQSGLIIPVKRTHANGLPLGGEGRTDEMKLLILDSGLTLRLLKLSIGEDHELLSHILTSPAQQLVNKGPLAEMIGGLEMLRYQTPNLQHELYYWAREERNSMAEIDYLLSPRGKILPVEIKSGVQGGMKSLWIFLKEKKLKMAVRSSLENFGIVTPPVDNKDFKVIKCPLYAMSQLWRLIE